MAQPIPPKNYKLTDLTILAEKYGHPTGPGHEAIVYQFPFKSGITPLPNPPFKTDQETFDFLEQEIHQRVIELHAVEGLAPMLDPTHDFLDDTIEIHPLYQRAKWGKPLQKHLAKYPIGGGKAGYWEADNPIVWDAILPAVRMASLFLSSSHFWPWWDALIAGEHKKIPSVYVPEPYKNSTYLNFKLRDPVVAGSPEEQAHIQTFFRSICKHVDLSFGSGRAVHGGMAKARLIPPEMFRDGKHAYGTTGSISRYFDTVRVSLAFELAEPLLRDDLTSAERAVDLFRFAATLVHETAHVVVRISSPLPDFLESPNTLPRKFVVQVSGTGKSSKVLTLWKWMASVSYNYNYYNNAEPFFENELFGGVATDLLTYKRGPDGRFTPAAGVLQGGWNTTYHEDYQLDQPCLTPRPPNFNVSELWMIPAHNFLNMTDKNFWSGFVQSFGTDSKVLYFRPKTIGVRRTKPLNAPRDDNYAAKWPKELLRAPAPSIVDYAPLPIDRSSLTPAKIIGLEFENKRRALAQKVYRAVTGVQNRRENVKMPQIPPPPSPSAPPVYKAAKNYVAKDTKELSLTDGEPIKVLAKHPDGYWECSNDAGKSGLVPSSALKEVPGPPPPPPLRTSGRPEPTRQLPITGNRFNEIRKYLFRNIRELALDTLNFKIPEHILFNYVLENRGLDITSDEWRDFLMTAGNAGLLFSLVRDGPSFGVVTKLAAGWPTAPLPPRPRPSWGDPNRTIMTTFQNCATKIGNRYPFFQEGLRDHDLENFRRICNEWYYDNPEWLCRTRLGMPVKEFSEDLFEAIIWKSEKDGGGFAFGPKGTIRKTKLYDDPPSKKRKRDHVTDFCTNM
ncbi:hypothetical protein VTL71DRAFT_8253 [Oculimacula yallundae]|uniref:SH3 domain-containing protein n=1 Tax=Oculimacula yallundae TaxID=86028 RepID=A0ABR4CX56_9HELO